MRKLSNYYNNEQGESQMGLIVVALVIGCFVAVGTWVQDYIVAHKDAKTHTNNRRIAKENKKLIPVKRAPTGHTLQY